MVTIARIASPAALATAGLLWMAAPVPLGAAEVYRVDSLPDDLDKIPCSAWRRGEDGSWQQVATIIAGGQEVSGGTFLQTKETLMLEGRCKPKAGS